MDNEKMEFFIKPTSEISIMFGDKHVGHLLGIGLDFNHKNLLGIPKIELGILLRSKAFAPATLNKILKLVSKMNSIKLTIVE